MVKDDPKSSTSGLTANPARQTCWTHWLRRKSVICPSLPAVCNGCSSKLEIQELIAAAGDSYILKVRLHGGIYALKLVCMQLQSSVKLTTFNQHTLSHSQPYCTRSNFGTLAERFDPFLVECQMYNLLFEHNKIGHVGPRCYGWLTITEDQEHRLDRDLRWTFEWGRHSDTQQDPVRGLLLEYIDGCKLDKATLTVPAAQSLRDQLSFLHSLWIMHADLEPRNILVAKDGRAFLIDFSGVCFWPYVPYKFLKKKDAFRGSMMDEDRMLEFFFNRLQKARHLFQGIIISLPFRSSDVTTVQL